MHRAIANYAPSGSSEEELLKKHASLIDRAARRLVARTGLSSAYDDLWSAGAPGQVEVARRPAGSHEADLHYVEGLTYRELGQVMSVSEPRVCQLHGEALQKLRGLMS